MRVGFDPDLFEPLADVEERSFWFRARNRLITSAVRRHFPDARSFLEVGCGGGVVLVGLREAFPELRLVGVELYSQGLDVARRRLPDTELHELDARNLPYENEFDVVGAFDVIEHVDEDEEVLAQMVQATRPGGGILVLVPQHQWLWSDMDRVARHVRRYRRGELRSKAEAAGLEVAYIGSFVTALLPAMIVSRVLRRLSRRPFDAVAELEPGPLNGIFERILDGERKLIERGVSLPLGGSLLLVGRKPQLP